MTNDTLRNDTIITDILDNDISKALEKLSVLLSKVARMISIIKISKIDRITPETYSNPQ